MKKPQVALIGICGYAKTHLSQLYALANKGEIELAAAAVRPVDDNPAGMEKLKELGAEIYSSTDEMFSARRGKLDLVCIPTGIASHEPLTIQALESGANVLVEKPAAGSSEAIRRMMEAEKKSGKFVAVGFQHMYAREIHFIKQYLLSGRLGKIKRISCKGLWPRPTAYYQRNDWSGKIAAADGTQILDSPINNAFAHYLNIELFLAGSTFATSIHANSVEGELYRARKEIETFDTCALRFQAENDIELLTLLTHTTDLSEHPIIRVECENGSVYWELNSTWNICSESGKTLYSGYVETPHPDMFMDLIRRIKGENVFLCPLNVAMEHTHCIELISDTLTAAEPVESVSALEPTGQLVLKDVNAVFNKCFLAKSLPSEMGIRWK